MELRDLNQVGFTSGALGLDVFRDSARQIDAEPVQAFNGGAVLPDLIGTQQSGVHAAAGHGKCSSLCLSTRLIKSAEVLADPFSAKGVNHRVGFIADGF